MLENKDELARIITAENVSRAAGPDSAGGAARCGSPSLPPLPRRAPALLAADAQPSQEPTAGAIRWKPNNTYSRQNILCAIHQLATMSLGFFMTSRADALCIGIALLGPWVTLQVFLLLTYIQCVISMTVVPNDPAYCASWCAKAHVGLNHGPHGGNVCVPSVPLMWRKVQYY